MPKQLEEIKSFATGLISSPSVVDTPKEAATYSLNIAANKIQGTLSGISDNKVMGSSSWANPRYAVYRLKLINSANFDLAEYSRLWFHFDTYNQKYFVWFGTSGSDTDFVGSSNQRQKEYDDFIYRPNQEEVRIDISACTSDSLVAVVSSNRLLNLGPPVNSFLYNNVADTWFGVQGEEISNEIYMKFISQYYGEINPIDMSITSNNHISNHGFSVPEINGDIIGSGKTPIELLSDFNFKYIKTIDKRLNHSFFGVTGTSLLYSDSIYSNQSDIVALTDTLSNDGLNNISSVERNSNLYLGLGSTKGTKTKWVGHIKRKQLERDIDEVLVEDAQCHRPNKRIDDLDFDQIVVPTLHSGMNSENSMIAGAASLYGAGSTAADFGGADVEATGTLSCYRTLNGWIMKSLSNAGIAFQSDGITASTDDSTFHWDSLKRGMIFRVNIGQEGDATKHTVVQDSSLGAPAAGTALNELRRIKEIGYADTSAIDDGAAEGVELHDGDLFQVVTVPSGAASGQDTTAASTGDVVTYPRLIYVGSLLGNNTDHDSTNAYYPAPAWSYAVRNDGNKIHRIALSECNDEDITSANTSNTFSTAGATGNTTSNTEFLNRVTSVSLNDVIYEGFEIGTLSHCISMDGNGGISGRTGTLKKGHITNVAVSGNDVTFTVQDAASSGSNLTHGFIVGDWVTISGVHDNHNGTHQITAVPATHTFTCVTGGTNTDNAGGRVEGLTRNFYSGHGKLWVTSSNPNDVNSVWLLDVVNWHGDDEDNSRVTAKQFALNFSRIHDSLISPAQGKGMVEEPYWSKIDPNNPDTEPYEWVDRNWSNTPTDAYIGGICETYSHQPHLDDGAATGAGNGKWRVWFNDCKKEETETFNRWDLFLYNIRPTEFSDLGNSRGAYAYDKTPPYQECSSFKANSTWHGSMYESSTGHCFYPKDKFMFTFAPLTWNPVKNISNGSSNSDGMSGLNLKVPHLYTQTKTQSGTNNYRYADNTADIEMLAAFKTGDTDLGTGADNYDVRFAGGHFFVKGNETTEKRLENQSNMIIREGMEHYTNCNSAYAKDTPLGGPMIKDPSGMWHMLEAGMTNQMSYLNDEGVHPSIDNAGNLFTFSMGKNIGWLNSNFVEGQKGPREVKNYRHCLVPYHLEWFHTGGTDATQEYKSGTASKVAHQVNLISKVSGKFVRDGGVFGICGTKGDSEDGGGDRFWNVVSNGSYSDFNDTHFTFAVHDSPCAFTTTSAATDSTTGNTLTDWGGGNEIQGRPGKDTSTVDIIANLNTDKAVAPSLGFSAYNQFRWGHGKNGTDDISAGNDGTAYAGDSLWITWDGYNGDDGYGHYNNITTTWSSAGDIGFDDRGSYNRIDRTVERLRGFNVKLTKFDGSGSNVTYNTTVGTSTTDVTQENQDMTHGGVEGSGYFTYHANNEAQQGTEDKTTRVRGHYQHNATYSYLLADSSGTKIVDGSEAPLGAQWDNRRIVFCWNTLEGDTGHQASYDASDRQKNPRCAMKKIDKAFISYDKGEEEKENFVNIHSVDLVPIYDTNFSVNKIGPGLMISGDIPDGEISYNMVGVFYGQKIQGIYNKSQYRYRGFTVARPNYKTDSTRHNHKRCYNNKSMKIKNLAASTFQAGTAWDLYSPIIVGTDKTQDKSILSTWRRSAWPTMTTSNQTLELPAFNYDRFYNMNASESGTFPFGLDNTSNTVIANRFPTEGTSSNAGTNSGDTESPTVSHSTTAHGAHYKTSELNMIDFRLGEEDKGDAGEFKIGDVVEYTVSYLYDGFQDSPISSQSWVYSGTHPTITNGLDKSYEQITATIKMPKSHRIKISKRVTHLIVWRRNNFYEDYRLVKQIDLSELNQGLLDENDNYIIKIVDKKSFETYQNLTGVSQTLLETSLNYSVSTQVNDFLFVTKAYHPSLKENQNFIFRSKPGKFSIFDWSTDYIALPSNPIALASFAGKLFAFSKENMYKINPDQLFVESVLEGVGILNQNSIVVTDYGMFFCDANNMYHYDGSKAVPIGDTVIDNSSNPEWSIGYKKAVKKALSKGYSPLVEFDARNKCVYFIIKGYSQGVSSYVNSSSRAYCYSFETGRFDYITMPAVKTSCIGRNGDVILSDGYQLWGNRLSTHKTKAWSWESKVFDLGSLIQSKNFKKIKFTGSPTLINFNGSSNDDIKIFIDGIQQNMNLELKNYSVTSPIAGFTADQNWNGNNDADTGAIYSLVAALPSSGEVTYGGTTKDSFILDANSMPEFVSGELTEQTEPVKEGEIERLKYISPGQYLMMEMTNNSNNSKVKEIVKVTSVNFIWADDNTISRVEIGCDRGQLGTKAFDFQNALSTNQSWEHASIRYVGFSLKFPSGAKGKSLQVKMKNQRGSVESISFIYRGKTVK